MTKVNNTTAAELEKPMQEDQRGEGARGAAPQARAAQQGEGVSGAFSSKAPADRGEDTFSAASQARSVREGEGPADSRAPRRYTYLDCLRGTVPLPQNVNGATIFQVLMVGGMVTFMVTINGLRNTGFEFFANSHWLYPLMFCLAFLVRTFVGAPLVGKLAPKLVFSRFEGVARGIAMTVLNVCCMAPIMCGIATLLIVGVTDFPARYVTTLPIIAPLAMLVNYFVVGPIAKLVFVNRISPAGGLGMLENLEQNAPNLARLLGC